MFKAKRLWPLGGSILASVVLLNTGEDKYANAELKYVAIVTRHGYRTPLGTCPLNKQWNDCTGNTVSLGIDLNTEAIPTNQIYSRKYLKEENGAIRQLTKNGAALMVEVGKILREKYVATGFLPDILNPSILYVRSTDTPRTVETVQSVLNGMYPSEKRKTGKEGIVSIFSYDSSSENMYARSQCSVIPYLQRDITSTITYKAHFKRYEDLKVKVESIIGKKIGSWVGLYNHLDCYKGDNVPLPRQLTPALLEQIRIATADETFYRFGSEQLVSLSIGRFLSDIVSGFEQVRSKKSNTKFAIYSGHDNTLSPLLRALDIFKEHPPMGSFLILEFYQIPRGDYLVRILFNNSVQALSWGGGKDWCTLNEFYDRVKRFIPKNYKADCQLPTK